MVEVDEIVEVSEVVVVEVLGGIEVAVVANSSAIRDVLEVSEVPAFV